MSSRTLSFIISRYSVPAADVHSLSTLKHSGSTVDGNGASMISIPVADVWRRRQVTTAHFRDLFKALGKAAPLPHQYV